MAVEEAMLEHTGRLRRSRYRKMEEAGRCHR